VHPVEKIITRFTPLKPKEWLSILPFLTCRWVDKGSTLLAQGEVCRHLWFIESGLLRFYFIDDKGNEITKFFTEAPYCLTSQRSFNRQLPSEEAIETLEDSVIWEMNSAHANALLVIPAWSAFIRNLVMEVQGYTEQLLVEAQTIPAEKRYAKLLALHSGGLAARVPVKMLASYLGIAPQSLSRIRKKLAIGQTESNKG
jgi:CRP/FNR family transcriptional regulator, anaerobic regulatory protein